MGEFTIHAYVPGDWEKANLWAWYAPDGGNAFGFWPGAEMKENERKVFETSVPDWVNTVILSGNGGEIQTGSIPVESRELWITVNDDLSCALSYESPEIKLSAVLPDDWRCPRVWAWSDKDGRNAFNIWPGIEMDREEDAWTAYLPRWTDRLIISSMNEEHRSRDTAFEAGRDIFIKADDSGELALSYEPEREYPPEKPEQENQDVKPCESEKEPETIKEPAPYKNVQEMPAQEYRVKEKRHRGLLLAAAAVIAGIAAAVILRRKRR